MPDITPAYEAANARAFDNVRQSVGSAALINGRVLRILFRFLQLQPVFPGELYRLVPFALEALDHQWERQCLAENERLSQRPSKIFIDNAT